MGNKISEKKRIVSGIIDLFIFLIVFNFTSLYLVEVYFLLMIIFVLLTKGQTIGQLIINIKLISTTSIKISYLQIFVRQSLSILNICIYITYLIGFNRFLINKKGQIFADKIAQTMLLEKINVDSFYKTNQLEQSNISIFAICISILFVLWSSSRIVFSFFL